MKAEEKSRETAPRLKCIATSNGTNAVITLYGPQTLDTLPTYTDQGEWVVGIFHKSLFVLQRTDYEVISFFSQVSIT
jgi:hypothetical protein